MSWDDETWTMFCALMRRGWPGEFTGADATAYRVLLDGTDPPQVVEALRRLLLRGQRFRPSAAELLGELRADPSRPTFAEAYRLIFGKGGVLRARPATTRWASERERLARFDDAARARAAGMHPLVAAFVDRQGLDRLRSLPLEDPDWGEKHRRDLEQQWDTHVEAFDGREVAALATGRGRGELERFDPLAALGVAREPAPALEAPAGDEEDARP